MCSLEECEMEKVKKNIKNFRNKLQQQFDEFQKENGVIPIIEQTLNYTPIGGVFPVGCRITLLNAKIAEQ